VIIGLDLTKSGVKLKKNYKFHGELRVQVQKLETKDQDENDAELWG
jgi:hypothetical protein